MDSLLRGAIVRPPCLKCTTPVELSAFPQGRKRWRHDILKGNPKYYLVSVEDSNCRSLNIIKKYSIVRSQAYHVNRFAGSLRQQSTFSWILDKQFSVNASSEHPLESKPEAKGTWKSIQTSLDAFYRFSRPHTVIGTVIGIISVSLLAIQRLSDFSPLFFMGLLEAIIAAVCMNIYIVGLNQLFDIEIDKVNKPYLPLASGEYSVGMGVGIVASFALMSFFLGWIVGSWPLFSALFVSFILGTAYSINLPLLRWKRFALIAAMCILAVRAVVVQLAFFLHIQTFVYRRPPILTWPLVFTTAFMSFFSIVIALFKDIPDIDGDRIFGIRSFSVRLGQKRVFWICIYLLEIAYAVAMLVGAASSCLWSKFITVLGHGILALILWNQAKSLDLKNKVSITSFYMFIWKVNPNCFMQSICSFHW
ncbi:PREDICTED: homogentisate phytyltransferase 1, chloroplastic-like isoform X1 [Nelumbo nucifera]|uniref:Homogentisate phytyltransferase 1, chloroplastic-like isoform X1 n=1 Tax=Nelumbo nucifera TaxID=4432 RepID=A0A1U8AI23_NELNU|nr:PREDICTED: homogentisate phytyltransferase 1, chloroplastic-like isoform X1 [Nelumbo nucifera]